MASDQVLRQMAGCIVREATKTVHVDVLSTAFGTTLVTFTACFEFAAAWEKLLSKSRVDVQASPVKIRVRNERWGDDALKGPPSPSSPSGRTLLDSSAGHASFLSQALAWDSDTRRNAFGYLAEIFITTGALFTVGSVLPQLMVPGRQTELMTDATAVHQLCTTIGLMLGLYLFELAYKPRVGWDLAVHHIVASYLGMMVVFFLPDLHADHVLPSSAGVLAAMVFQSLTEQAIFIGVLLRRLGYHGGAALMFLISIGHTLLVKASFALYSFGLFVIDANSYFTAAQHTSSKVFLITGPALMLLLLATQMYIVRVYLYLYRGSRAKADSQAAGRRVPGAGEEPTPRVAASPQDTSP